MTSPSSDSWFSETDDPPPPPPPEEPEMAYRYTVRTSAAYDDDDDDDDDDLVIEDTPQPEPTFGRKRRRLPSDREEEAEGDPSRKRPRIQSPLTTSAAELAHLRERLLWLQGQTPGPQRLLSALEAAPVLPDHDGGSVDGLLAAGLQDAELQRLLELQLAQDVTQMAAEPPVLPLETIGDLTLLDQLWLATLGLMLRSGLPSPSPSPLGEGEGEVEAVLYCASSWIRRNRNAQPSPVIPAGTSAPLWFVLSPGGAPQQLRDLLTDVPPPLQIASINGSEGRLGAAVLRATQQAGGRLVLAGGAIGIGRTQPGFRPATAMEARGVLWTEGNRILGAPLWAERLPEPLNDVQAMQVDAAGVILLLALRPDGSLSMRQEPVRSAAQERRQPGGGEPDSWLREGLLEAVEGEGAAGLQDASDPFVDLTVMRHAVYVPAVPGGAAAGYADAVVLLRRSGRLLYGRLQPTPTAPTARGGGGGGGGGDQDPRWIRDMLWPRGEAPHSELLVPLPNTAPRSPFGSLAESPVLGGGGGGGVELQLRFSALMSPEESVRQRKNLEACPQEEFQQARETPPLVQISGSYDHLVGRDRDGFVWVLGVIEPRDVQYSVLGTDAGTLGLPPGGANTNDDDEDDQGEEEEEEEEEEEGGGEGEGEDTIPFQPQALTPEIETVVVRRWAALRLPLTQRQHEARLQRLRQRLQALSEQRAASRAKERDLLAQLGDAERRRDERRRASSESPTPFTAGGVDVQRIRQLREQLAALRYQLSQPPELLQDDEVRTLVTPRCGAFRGDVQSTVKLQDRSAEARADQVVAAPGRILVVRRLREENGGDDDREALLLLGRDFGHGLTRTVDGARRLRRALDDVGGGRAQPRRHREYLGRIRVQPVIDDEDTLGDFLQGPTMPQSVFGPEELAETYENDGRFRQALHALDARLLALEATLRQSVGDSRQVERPYNPYLRRLLMPGGREPGTPLRGFGGVRRLTAGLDHAVLHSAAAHAAVGVVGSNALFQVNLPGAGARDQRRQVEYLQAPPSPVPLATARPSFFSALTALALPQATVVVARNTGHLLYVGDLTTASGGGNLCPALFSPGQQQCSLPLQTLTPANRTHMVRTLQPLGQMGSLGWRPLAALETTPLLCPRRLDGDAFGLYVQF